MTNIAQQLSYLNELRGLEGLEKEYDLESLQPIDRSK